MLRMVFAFSLFIVVSGCAVQPGARGGLDFRPDFGEFGDVVGTFQLDDGSEGKLRRDLTGQYSIKLSKYLKVIPLDHSPVMAKIAHSSQLQQQAVVVIEATTKECKYSYQLFAFSGPNASGWQLGECNTLPAQIKNENGALTLDFDHGTYTRKVTYASGRVSASTSHRTYARPTTPKATDADSKPQRSNETAANRKTDTPSSVKTTPPSRDERNSATTAGSDDNTASDRYRPPSVVDAPGKTSSASRPASETPPADKTASKQKVVIPDLTFGTSEVKPTRKIILTD